MKPQQALKELIHHITMDEPLLLLGSPGVGKSRITDQATEAVLGKGVKPVLFSAITRQVTDFGFPVPDMTSGTVKMMPPDNTDLPTKAPAVLFLDEITQAVPLMQAALLQLLGDERRVGAYHPEPGVSRVAAGNRPKDRTGAGRLISALADRMTIITLEPDVDQWVTWALGAEIAPEVIAYIRWFKHKGEVALNDWDSSKDVNATPRSWERVSRLLKGMAEDTISETLAGIVGEGHSAQFSGFLALHKNLPDPDSILLDPNGAPVPSMETKDGVPLLFALSSALAARCTPGTAKSLVTYARRMPPEMQVCLLKDAGQVNSAALHNNREFQKWASDNQVLFE